MVEHLPNRYTAVFSPYLYKQAELMWVHPLLDNTSIKTGGIRKLHYIDKNTDKSLLSHDLLPRHRHLSSKSLVKAVHGDSIKSASCLPSFRHLRQAI